MFYAAVVVALLLLLLLLWSFYGVSGEGKPRRNAAANLISEFVH